MKNQFKKKEKNSKFNQLTKEEYLIFHGGIARLYAMKLASTRNERERAKEYKEFISENGFDSFNILNEEEKKLQERSISNKETIKELFIEYIYRWLKLHDENSDFQSEAVEIDSICNEIITLHNENIDLANRIIVSNLNRV